MKKYIYYILILVAMVGLFAPASDIQAVGASTAPCPTGQQRVGNNCITPISSALSNPNALGGGAPTVGPNDYVYLAPIPCDSSDSGCFCTSRGCTMASFDPTKDESLGIYLNMMLKVFIGICAVLAVIMIIMGGLEYMTSELGSSKEAGKHKITGAILGLLLALGSYAILNTLNPDLLKSNLDITKVTVFVTTTENHNVAQAPVNGKYKTGETVGEAWEGDGNKAGPAKSKEELLSHKAQVYNSECKTVGQTGCTSTAGLKFTYIDTIKDNCVDCGVLLITGGTEFWAHGGATGSTSHGVDSPTIDINATTALTTYIMSGKQTSANRWEKDGISYLDERGKNNHWHAGP